VDYDIVKQASFNRKTVFSCLLAIGIIGLLIRLYFEPQIPLTGDSSYYFVYAADTSLTGKLSESYYLTNNGWPMFLSILFSSTKLDDPLFLMELQRFSSIIISTVTIVPMYFLCRRFFNPEYSLIGASLFAFEPYIIINSSLGITEPIFLFLGISSLALFLNNNHKLIYGSFAMAGLFTLIRFEGMIFFVIISVLFLVKYRHKKRIFLQYPLLFAVYALILLPVAYSNLETHDRDGFLDELFGISGYSYTHFIQGTPEIGDPIYGDTEKPNMQKFLTIGTTGMLKFLGLLLVPVSVFFAALGLVLIIKNKKNIKINYPIITIILTSTIMLLPAFYAYGRGSEDVRFVFMGLPLIILVSLYGINKWKIKRKNLMVVLIIAAIILASFIFLDFKKINYDYDKEVFSITKFIVGKTNVINGDSVDIKYRSASALIVNWPNLPLITCTPDICEQEAEVGAIKIKRLAIIPTSNEQSLIEFIGSAKDEGLTHLAVDGREHQPEFLRDVFYHDEKYAYLEKIYDSSELGMKYHVKIYEIDFVRIYGN
jgi:hypothetical protein